MLLRHTVTQTNVRQEEAVHGVLLLAQKTWPGDAIGPIPGWRHLKLAPQKIAAFVKLERGPQARSQGVRGVRTTPPFLERILSIYIDWY